MALTYGFELLKDEEIPEINSRALLYRHAASGAQLLSLINEDENKVFGVTFRTPPLDSTGVAHIMEHSVLCGSRKYPLKEPFVELVKGSLNTFLNAMTYPDKTCYPVASQNLQDFYNLIDVYLDAVFYPRIDPFTLKQEGWHYELDSPGGEMAYKGVVFNEMKGAYSSPESVLGEAMQHALFPDTTYGIDSGGDPAHIPDLTYAAFKGFHERYYHPSNAYIFFYGDDDPEKRLELLDAYLKDFSAIRVDSAVALQPRFTAPRRAVVPYEVSEEGQGGEKPKSMLLVSWLLPEGADVELVYGLQALQHILTGTPASPLRKALIDSGLGEDLTGGDLETGARQMYFNVGMKGLPAENVEKVEPLILNTLSSLAADGIDPDTIAASLNTIEFRLREKNFGSFPRGLVMMLSALESWIYDRDPFEGLRYEAPLQALKTRLAKEKNTFENLIREHLLDNSHRVTVTLEPDAGLAQRRLEDEQGRLQAARQAMTEAETAQVIADAAELRRRQETPDSPEALAAIPTLALSDLPPKVRVIPSEALRLGGGEVLFHDLFTNGILYLDLGFNLHNLPGEWLSYLPLFGRALTETGTKQQSFVQLQQRIGQTTGGIHSQLYISSAPGRSQAEAWMFLRGKAMVNQAGDLLDIYDDILRGARLDDQNRFRQMVLEEKAGVEAGAVRAGHRLVNSRLKSHFDEAGWANEQIGGVSYLFFLRDLAGRVERDWPAVQARLEEIRQAVLNREGVICNVTLDAGGWTQIQERLSSFLAGLPARPAALQPWQINPPKAAEGLTIPAQINFVGMGGNLFQAGYQLNGSILAIVNYINSTWIWEKVRVQGGAYGGWFTFDQHSGVMSFLSYRDPNVLATLENYRGTAGFLRNLEISPAELTKAVIGAVGELDSYQLPDAKGFTALVRQVLGISTEWRQKFRDELLGIRPQDFKTLAQAVETAAQNGQVAVLGSEKAIQAAGEQRPGWFEIQQVL